MPALAQRGDVWLGMAQRSKAGKAQQSVTEPTSARLSIAKAGKAKRSVAIAKLSQTQSGQSKAGKTMRVIYPKERKTEMAKAPKRKATPRRQSEAAPAEGLAGLVGRKMDG